ncbi:MAG: AI-2E family transporter [Thermoleophilaceae bacterium]|nr:AI-2E family transporter [Thermoleophilaceae bacterium]
MRQASEPPDPARRGAGGSLRATVLGPAADTPLARAAQVSLQFLLVAAALAVAGYVVVQLRLVVLPLLVAVFLATILMPAADWLRRRIPDAIAAFVVMLVALALLGGLTAVLAPSVVSEFGDLGESLREGLGQIGSTLERVGFSQAEIDGAIDDALTSLQDNVGGIGQGVVTGALFVGELVTGLLLALVLLFFLLKDGHGIWNWIVALVPARRRDGLREVGSASWSTLGHYLRGVALVALFDGVTIGVALAILGVPLVLPLAVLTFFGAFFPLVGAFTAGFVAALVALVSEGPVTALIVVGVIVAIQQLEGDLIYPVLVGRQIRLHPVAILLVLTAGAVVAGIVGALFAVPAAAVGWTAIQHLRGERRPKDITPPPGEG